MSLRARVLPGLFLVACATTPPVAPPLPVEASRPSRFTSATGRPVRPPPPAGPASPIEWHEDRDEAAARAAREGKPLLVFVVATWQPRTQHLERTLWTDDDVRRAASAVVAVRVDASDTSDAALEQWLTERGIDHVPAVGLILPDGSVAGALTGPEVAKAPVLRLLRR